MSKIIDISNLSKSFNQGNESTEVLKNINLSIDSGEFVGLVGPSGSGKTTLLQICGLLDNPTSGSIFINNLEISKASDEIQTKIRKNHIGFIYQFHHLMPEFSALENVAIPLLINGINKKIAYETAKKILNEVELSDRYNFYPSQLSGGQQQRVAIARAIVYKPQLILADEPTGNLDSELSEKIFLLLKNMVKKYNIACLVVTHNNELAKLTDRLIKIKDGKIEE
jgi:lipoprotein-releasing system ATP-binding protein